MTVNEVSKLSGVSIRTLQYYDNIGLLSPSGRSDSGYRLYSEDDLNVLQQILLFRELMFPLKEIKEIVNAPDFNKEQALKDQIELLTIRRDRIDGLISMAKKLGGKNMNKTDFTAFDKSREEEFRKKAREKWGNTSEWKEAEEKEMNRTDEEKAGIAQALMQKFTGFGEIKMLDPASGEAAEKVKDLQAFITSNYYNCTDRILAGLGVMYTADPEFAKNIDAAGGEGTAVFVSKAIEAYCRK